MFSNHITSNKGLYLNAFKINVKILSLPTVLIDQLNLSTEKLDYINMPQLNKIRK